MVTNAGLASKTYLNPGTNIFSTVTPSSVGGSSGINAALALALGDLDSNGFVDIVAGNKVPTCLPAAVSLVSLFIQCHLILFVMPRALSFFLSHRCI